MIAEGTAVPVHPEAVGHQSLSVGGRERDRPAKPQPQGWCVRFAAGREDPRSGRGSTRGLLGRARARQGWDRGSS